MYVTKTLSQRQVSIDLILNLHPVNHALPYLNTFTFSVSHTHVFSLERECHPYMHTKLFISISFVLSLCFCILFHNNALLDSIPFSVETGMKVCADDDL